MCTTIHTNTYVCMWPMSTCMCVGLCMYVCMYVCIYACMYNVFHIDAFSTQSLCGWFVNNNFGMLTEHVMVTCNQVAIHSKWVLVKTSLWLVGHRLVQCSLMVDWFTCQCLVKACLIFAEIISF